jgi:hypothetical protein
LQGVGDLPYTLLGAPVEIGTGLLRAGGMAQGEQVGGIDYIKRKATELGIRPPDSDDPTMRDMRMGAEIAMGGVDPTRVARAGGAVAGAVAREAKPIIGDALENYMAKSGLAPRMTVFHGSPYKFNAFDPTKIGSGEGAQAYGYGHYVAESPDVAKSYAVDASSNNAARTFAPRSNAIQNSIDYFEAMLKNEVSRDLKNGVAVSDDYIKSQIAQLNDQLPSVYKIDLPDDQIAKMLDWDAEISKQSKEVQDLAKQYGLNMDDLGGDLVAAMDAKRPAGAESMRQAGVPGIKYFDAQSRGGQKADTRNFVVFPKNEGLLKIEEVNGQPVQSGLLDTDYRGSHSAPNAEVYGATLDDLTKIMPADVYAPEGKQLYGLGDRLVDSEWRIAALKTRGKPDAEIEVYRAVPKGVKDINSGDWVTTSKTYADQHGERTLDGDYEIIKRKVKARTLSSEGYPYEFGYNE